MAAEQVSILGAQPFLRGMPGAQLAELAGTCQHVTVPAGRRLFDEGSPAGRFWIIDAGRVTLDASVPGQGRVIIETLGRGDVIGLSWMLPPYQWRFGAVTTQRMQAFAFDAAAVRAACSADPVLGYELTRRFSAVVVRRLQATRARLIEQAANPMSTRSGMSHV
jgi:CRP/FNR family transcriptional regulator, cyclic AMP receptor protein